MESEIRALREPIYFYGYPHQLSALCAPKEEQNTKIQIQTTEVNATVARRENQYASTDIHINFPPFFQKRKNQSLLALAMLACTYTFGCLFENASQKWKPKMQHWLAPSKMPQ